MSESDIKQDLLRPLRLQIRHLYSFIVLSEEGSLTGAAERLHISKPPLGRQIKYMENALGVKLFERKSNGMELTKSGRELLGHAYRILESCRVAEEQVSQSSEGAVEYLSIGFSDDFLFSGLSKVITDFSNERERVVLSANLAYGHEIVELINRRKLQVGLVNAPLPAHTMDLRSAPLGQAPICAALPSDDPLAQQSSLSLSQLAERTFISGDILPHNAFYLKVRALLRQANISPSFKSNIWPKEFQLDLVGQGAGITLLVFQQGRPTRSDVVFVPLDDAGAHVDRCVVWHEDDTSEQRQFFVEQVIERLG